MDLKPEMSVTDLAFTILKNYGKPMHFKQLISEVMRVKGINQENPGKLLAQMHTEISLDSRFIHQGNGEWGLRDWQPKAKVVKIRPESAPAPAKRGRGALRLDEEDEFDLEGEEEEGGSGKETEDEYEMDEEELDEDELEDDDR